MDSIEKAGERDWRATREYMSLIDPEQFNDRAQQPSSNVQVNVYAQMGIDIAALLQQGADRNKGKVLDVVEVKQLPMNTGDK